MNDSSLDQLISAGARDYRVPPPFDAASHWHQLEQRRRRGVTRAWWRPLAFAASLALAFALGRATRPAASPPGGPSVAANTGAPVTMAAALLGESVILLTSLPEASTEGQDQRFAREAGDLLATTRLLLDSPEAQHSPALASLLDDLELVLAQVARLREGESRTERELINDAVQQQDLVPRIRTVAARLAAGD